MVCLRRSIALAKTGQPPTTVTKEPSSFAMPTPSKDLWASALEDLTEIDRQQLNFYHSQDELTILSDLQVLTESAKEQCIKKRWRFSRPGRNGETIVLRDIFTKIVVWIERFKQVGDTVVQYDPGHAALPWAGVRFILQVAIGDIVKFDFVVEGAESIARMLGRYAIFEEIYLHRTSKASMELENALVRLYSTILMYQSKAKRFFDQSSSKRILRSAFVREDEFRDLARKMDLEQSHVDHCAATLRAENQNNINDSLEALSITQREKHARLIDLLHSMDGPILRMNSQLNDIEDNLDKSKRFEILRWLSAQPYIEHHEQISKKALAGTGKWLLEDLTYTKWHRGSTSSLLWLHGKVGAGKSTLVSIVIEDAMRRTEAGQSPPPVYFYCSRDPAEPQRSDPAAILSSIVRQLSCAEPGLPLLPPVIEKYEKKGQGFSSQGLQIEESRELITKLIEHYPVTTIVIDALDECNPEKREMLLDAIESLLQDSSLGLLKVFLSSRDDQDIACTLREYPNLDLVSSRNSADIEVFVREETNRLVKKQRLLRNSHAKEALKTLIINQVSRGADGMFRWAGLQLELLCTLKLDQDIKAKLGRIPPKLEQLYQEIYEKNLLKYASEVGQSIIKNIMKWLVCAQRPMKSSKFCTAVVLNTAPTEELTKEHVLDLCHNFVVFDDSLDVFRFAHLSVREFLEKQPEYIAHSCHLLAAETCLLQLIGLSNCSAAKAFLQDHYTLELRGKAASTAELLGGFHTYAMMFWAKHCQLVGEEGRTINPRFERIFRFFLSDTSDDLSPLKIWIQYGQRSVSRDYISYCLKHDSDYKPGDRVYLVACAYAFCEIIRGCMNENPPEDWAAGCSLAIHYKEDEALKTILGNRSGDEIPIDLVSNVATNMDPDTLEWVLRKSKVDVTTLLYQLINNGGRHREAVESLVARYKPAEVSWTVLEYAAKFSSASTFETLLLQNEDRGISLDSLLEQAGQQRNWEVMRLLLDKKHFKSTPNLMQAIANVGDEKAMRLLLDREDAGEITSDVIQASCSNENEKILGLLLDRGAPDQISDKSITKAMKNSNERILSLLLKSGYPMSQTHVNDAAAYGYASHLRLLLDNGSLITGSVLRCAARNDCDGTNVMSLLLAEAKDCMITEEMTDMMKIAAFYDRLDVMRLLLERAGITPIEEDVLVTAATSFHQVEMIRMLSIRDWEMTEEVLEAMMRSLQSGEALQLVLDRLEDLEITGKILIAAAGNPLFGDRVVGQLLDRVNLLDVIDPLLVEAAGNRHLGLDVILLVKRRVGDINVSHKAIERAAREGSVRTMTFFLDHMSVPVTEAMVVNALMNYSLEMVQLVLDRANDLHITRTMVHMAARYSNPDCLASVWERASRAETDENITRDLAQAAIENPTWARNNLRFLLDKVENIVIGPEALTSIARRDQQSLLDLLVNYGINLQITLEVLQAAAESMRDGGSRSDGSLMTFLLAWNDKVELTDEIFQAAAGSGNQCVLQVLSNYCDLAEVSNTWLELVRLRDAVDPFYNEYEIYSHLAMGDTDSNVAVVTELLGRGVEPDVPDGDGRTPLFHAAARGNILTVQALLSAGANPNSTDGQGRTPLHYAATSGCYRIVEILLDLGVSTHLEDEKGRTPASIAKGEGNLKVFRLLERRRQPQ